VAALLAIAALALAGWQPLSRWAIDEAFSRIGSDAAGTTLSLSFVKCLHAGETDCVVDGDTLRVSNETIRLADIDAPETRDYACAAEKTRGDAATRRLLALVNAGPFEVKRYFRDEDVYGRKLRILMRDGTSLGATLVGEGLARNWDGARHPWC
jgi:endonuclease YncB( thermonuclease family)